MGVFDRFFRRKDEVATEAVAAEAEAAETLTAETEPAEEAGEGTSEAAAAEGVEIPKQQSAEAAADSETGEGART
ncbi:hypothetical protein OOK31_08560 [Streptomyces sp. NBC_00249]|uniref:hypothetical protein n=1 Tax=Streptomyces sp. NBC_00249 TaxID=2975690 RepID=UPI002256A0E6|nr:hypothetical protein [Streptomyces sp. NBC_00249]MCX5193947.1 hypothetical protein [Streptomyces sp. NBC_00249]